MFGVHTEKLLSPAVLQPVTRLRYSNQVNAIGYVAQIHHSVNHNLKGDPVKHKVIYKRQEGVYYTAKLDLFVPN